MKQLVAVLAIIGLASCTGQSSTLPITQTSFSSHSTQNIIPDAQSTGKIKHIIIVIQENRSMDNMMQGLPGADIATYGYNSQGQQVPLQPVPLEAGFDVNHSHSSFVTEYNNGNNNGFDQDGTNCPDPSTCAYSYVPQTETQPLLDLCAQYTCADEMYETQQGPSFTAHQYLISGTASAINNPTIPTLADPMSENPVGNYCAPACFLGGCDSSPRTTVLTINSYGVEGNPVFPCVDHPVLADKLDAAGISWKYYQNTHGAGLWNAMDAISHIRYGPDYANVVVPSSTVLTDIQNGTLAQVSWVTPSNANSDHSGMYGNGGPSWVASIVNAVGQSQYWSDTAIFITWDDWGGWYDHATPSIDNSFELGFRVPLIVVSPYAKVGYVSHVHHEFGSIIKFVEATFKLGNLGYTDQRSDNLMDCFNFPNKSSIIHISRFKFIKSRYRLSHFLHQGPDKPGTDTD